MPCRLCCFPFAQSEAGEAEHEGEQQAEVAEEGVGQIIDYGHAQGVVDKHAAHAPGHERVGYRAGIFHGAGDVARV